jgi:hypothetical protein
MKEAIECPKHLGEVFTNAGEDFEQILCIYSSEGKVGLMSWYLQHVRTTQYFSKEDRNSRSNGSKP